ncbi:protein ITPRID2 isoform X2 [Ascaphus truei]|uniref:protein ITPRID2 isoform X2 n=1 Tax=Ascaphus truei TaxID=8439 RepID=UPI003F593A66
MEEAVVEDAQSWAVATDKRKAWAKSRDSWQASEAEDVSTEATEISQTIQEKLQLAGESGNKPNEKIAIWLNDCRTPLGASLDDQTNPASFLKGMLLKNGGSFEDDLSLGAEANHLHQSNLPVEPTCNGMLAKDRRLQFYQKGRSMNSTGSGKSSATVSSVSELLDLYEEDPEEILYNLGFGRDEPDIAAKIPPRFFNSSSFAHGIDIKVFLSAQMQRLEVENPNYALTSRFRQIEVLTTVANAFSSLYSQVSGTPLQRIGSSASLSISKESAKPAPLNRAPSHTASRLLKTLSKLNLHGTQVVGESNTTPTTPITTTPTTTQPIDDQGHSAKCSEDDVQKGQKHFNKNSPLLATVKEEGSGNSIIITDLNHLDGLHHTKGNGSDLLHEDLAEPYTNKREETSSSQNELCDTSSIVDSSVLKDLNVSTDPQSQSCIGGENPHTSTPDKDPYASLPNPSVISLMMQSKDSFELEEVQSTEEEAPHVPSISRLALEKLGKDNLLRTASQHSDSSGFAEDPSADCPLTNALQVQESLQAMGSSADSCDSEATVTSVSEDLRTPVGTDQPELSDFENDEDFLTPVDLLENKVFFRESNMENLTCDIPQSPSEECNFGIENYQYNNKEDSELQQECMTSSKIEIGNEDEAVPYTTHHISEPHDCFMDYDGVSGLGNAESCSLERVNVALQRAQMKIFSSALTGSRTGRSQITSKDLLKRRHKFANSGYPLRRTQSLPSAELSPARVVSKLNIVLTSGKATVCSPPSFSYKYTPGEEEYEEEANTNCRSTLVVSPKSETKENAKSDPNKLTEDANRSRPQTCSVHAPSPRSHSSCSLHSLQSDWHERPFCEHARTWSTHSVPSFSGASCSALMSPFGCPLAQLFAYGSLQRPCSGHNVPVNCPPSTTEMQLRRVLHDIRSSLQNLSQYPAMRVNDVAAGGYNTPKPSILPLYENTFQELQVMRRSLNLFRTQMMDLELGMLRQQTMVYQHLTEDERYEADQLQSLRNSVRMELQELELQLDDRLLTLEEQLRNFHISSPFQRQTLMGMYGGRSTDNLVFPSNFNVIEPVTELIREQTCLKSELGFGDLSLEAGVEGCESISSHAASDSSSVCSIPLQKSTKGRKNSSDTLDKPKPHAPPSKAVYRASVALTPSSPLRAGVIQIPSNAEHPEDSGRLKSESTEQYEQVPSASATDENTKRTAEENKELQQVIREIKESIVGDIRREIVSGLLAAVSSPVWSLDGKPDGKL